MSKRFSIDSDGAESFFRTGPGGSVLWESGGATCTSCGCEVGTGKRNDEPAAELKARLKGKRAKVRHGVLACAGCGKEYAVRQEPEPEV